MAAKNELEISHNLYYQLLRIRMIEEAIAEKYREEKRRKDRSRQLFLCPYFFSELLCSQLGCLGRPMMPMAII